MYEGRRSALSLLTALLIYYAPALYVTVLHHGWPMVDGYLRGHLFDGFGCAAFFAIGWARLTHNPEYAAWVLITLSGGIAAAAAYVAGGNWEDILLASLIVVLAGWHFWHEVVDTIGRMVREATAKLDEQAVSQLAPRVQSRPAP